MAVLDDAASMTVLRPLLTYDKNQTIKIAEEIGTFSLSAKAGKCPFVPSSPLTKADLREVKYEESKLDIGSMVKASLKSINEVF
jgi:thiamine biosynthesis protein ThiI